ncbi:MAG: hypothetical protein Q7T53_11215 [Deltaproteobacteria bacterium]|nr:hypothetical protein [Deltaproteobacteria bacterium]
MAKKIKITKNKNQTPQVGHSVTIELKNISQPEKRFFANSIWAYIEDGTLFVCFGQRKMLSRVVKTCIVIAISAEGVSRYIDTLTEFAPQMEILVAKKSITVAELSPIDNEPEQLLYFTANAIVTSYAGREVSLDFHYIHPIVISGKETLQKYPVLPVIHIDTTMSILAAFIRYIESISSSLPPILSSSLEKETK